MTTKKHDEEPKLDPAARNPQVALGKGEQLGPDLLEFDEDGKVHAVDGVPEPAYDLNDPDDRAQPLDEEPKDYFAILDEAAEDDEVDADTGARTRSEGPEPKPEPSKASAKK
jgi:hypothetical protein